MQVVDPYDHFDSMSHSDARYCLSWFEILTYRRERYVLYGVGQWYNHMLDWLGMNYYHGRLPGSPVFDTVKDAETWLRFQVKHEAYKDGMTLPGHHSGEYTCSKGCSDREVKTIQQLLK